MDFTFVLDSETAAHNKRIITYFFHNHNSTIPELARELCISVPTTTKLINELVENGIVNDYGKGSSKVGRKPNTYGLNPRSGYFLGVDIQYNHLNLGISDFNGEMVHLDLDIPLTSPERSKELLFEVCDMTKEFIQRSDIDRSKVLNSCFTIRGRVNSIAGYSYSMFNFSETPLNEILSEKIGLPVCIENDTRAMSYGELLRGCVTGEKNILFVNLDWGLGMSIIIDGNVYEGKSGFAGEIGHTYVYDNEIICHCGKKGCLETEVSGSALTRKLIEKLKKGKRSILSEIYESTQSVSLNDIVDAVINEDLLCIELLEEIGEKIGVQLANMINIFNPELVVIGGSLSATGDYIIQPIKLAIKKHSLRLVSNDSKILCSKLQEKAGVIGACMTARKLMFERG